MEWTKGAIMLYGGVAGAAVTLIASVISSILLARGKKRIIRQLDLEYGERKR
jgi:hypothetical protein